MGKGAARLKKGLCARSLNTIGDEIYDSAGESRADELTAAEAALSVAG